MPQYRVVGVDRESGFDTELVVDAATPENARIKAELRGVIVGTVGETAVSEQHPHLRGFQIQSPRHPPQGRAPGGDAPSDTATATGRAGIEEFFSLRGRYNRARYIWTSLLVACPIAVAAVVLTESTRSSESITLVNAIAFVALLPMGVKRLHDLDWSGLWYLLFLLPCANLCVGLCLLIVKGTTGPNRYGPDPLAPD